MERDVVATDAADEFPDFRLECTADDDVDKDDFCDVDMVVVIEAEVLTDRELVEVDPNETSGSLDDEVDALIALEVPLVFAGDREVWLFKVVGRATELFRDWLRVLGIAPMVLVESVEAFTVLAAGVDVEDCPEDSGVGTLCLDDVLRGLVLLDSRRLDVEELVADIVYVISAGALEARLLGSLDLVELACGGDEDEVDFNVLEGVTLAVDVKLRLDTDLIGLVLLDTDAIDIPSNDRDSTVLVFIDRVVVMT